MSYYRDTGVVLRLHKLGEADRIVTFLTQRHGKVRAVAKGVRRTSSRFGARLEPFGHVDLQFHTGRTLDIVTQAVSIDAFGGALAADYPRYTAGCALLETADRLTPEEGEPARQLFLLLVGALRGLAGGTREPYLVLDAYLLRAMVIAGYAPAISECARCGVEGEHGPEGGRGHHRRFSVAAGGAVCEGCRPSGSVVPSSATWALLEALRDGDWTTAEASPTEARRDASGLVAAHLQWHLERTLRSLPLVDRRGPDAPPRVDLGEDDPTDDEPGHDRLAPLHRLTPADADAAPVGAPDTGPTDTGPTDTGPADADPADADPAGAPTPRRTPEEDIPVPAPSPAP